MDNVYAATVPTVKEDCMHRLLFVGQAFRVLCGFGKVILLSAVMAVPALAVDPIGSGFGSAAVIGGKVATENKPWVAALISNSLNPDSKISSSNFCGGALIGTSWVLTAAHCVSGRRASSFKVLLGRSDLDGTGGELLEVGEVIINEYWDVRDRHNDVAMLRLKTGAKEAPIQLSSSSIESQLTNSTVKIYGWGYSSRIGPVSCKVNFLAAVSNQDDFTCDTQIVSYGDNPKTMMEGSLKIANYADCQARYMAYANSIGKTGIDSDYYSSTRSPDILCGWDETGTQSPCYGDSGGPMVTTINGTEYLVGVANSVLTEGCEPKLEMASYASVSYNLWFIFNVLIRSQDLGFDSFCPRPQTVDVNYEPQGVGNVKVTAQWVKDSYAATYRLYYAVADSLGKSINFIELPSFLNSFSIVLATGQRFHIAVQGKGANCDGEVSEMKEVTVK